jgi:hypothetical protein
VVVQKEDQLWAILYDANVEGFSLLDTLEMQSLSVVDSSVSQYIQDDGDYPALVSLREILPLTVSICVYLIDILSEKDIFS